MSFSESYQSAYENDDAQEFEPLPEGTYEVSLRDVTTESHPDDNVHRTTLDFEIVDGEHSSRRIWDKVKHADTVAWKAVQISKGMELDGTPESWIEWAASVSEQKGKRFLVTTTNRTYDGKIYTGVKSLKTADDLPF
tara:strand:+ start:1553 stop:1963 length:411 start_codon:yes stop_codon:yes gene_type:complete